MALQSPGSNTTTLAGAIPPEQQRSINANGDEVDGYGRVVRTKAQVEASTQQAIADAKSRESGFQGALDKAAETLKPVANVVMAPGTGALGVAQDVSHGDFDRIPGDIAYAGTGGTVGNDTGPTTGSIITPHSVENAATSVAGAAGDAAGAVGNAVGAVVDAFGNAISPGGGGAMPTSADDEFRRRQLEYADQLQAVANGTAGPSAAEIQGRNLNDRAMAQQFGAAQAGAGNNSALAYRQALQNAAQMQNQQTADATANRAKEQAQARDQYGNLLTSGRTGDLTKYNTDVGASNVRYASDQDLKAKEIGAATGAASGIVSTLLMPTPTPGPVSDRRKKTDIGDGDDETRAMLDALKAHDFRYKDPSEPGAAPGKRTGVMAQDLEKSVAGRALVRDTPTGKEIDSPQAIGAMLAALAELNTRVKRVEGRSR